MKFFDFVYVILKAGNGGAGSVSFYKDWMQKRSRPDGGNGGNGGNIIFIASKKINDLSYFKKNQRIVSSDGENGKKRSRHGKNALDVVIEVPVGTVIFDKEKTKVLFDFQKDKQSFVVARGGLGGLGNEVLCKGKFPKPISQPGTLGEDKIINLDLRLFSNFAFIGLPNVGKTSLLNALTKSKARIGLYPFTTLYPNLGVLENNFENQKIIISDLPGLILDAHLNRGLGNRFLKHLFRCQIFIHVLDCQKDERKIIDDFLLINHELEAYHQFLKDIPQIIVFNKVDLCFDPQKQKKLMRYFKKFSYLFVSASEKIALDELKNLLKKSFLNYHQTETAMERFLKTQNFATFVYNYQGERELRLGKIRKNMWSLSGKAIITLLGKFDLENENDLLLFNKKLKNSPLYEKIKIQGVKNKDVVYIHGKCFVWKD